MSRSPTTPETTDLRRVVWWGLVLLLFAMAVSEWTSPDTGTDNTAFVDAGYRIDINHDDAATLQLLPGVGPSIADNIIAWRQTHGPFTSPEDLEDVRMIGPVLRERITPWVTFGAVTPKPAEP